MQEERDWSKLGWAIVWVGIAIYCFWRGYDERREIRRFEARAETTEGVVTSATQGFQSRDEAEPPHIEYEFEVGGETYTGASEVYAPEGDPVQVRYLPSDPSTNLAVGHTDNLVGSIGLGVFAGAFGIWLALMGFNQQTAKRVGTTLEPSPLWRFAVVVLGCASAFLLYNAPNSNPYSFYQFLRWVVCVTAILLAYCSFNWWNSWAPWLFGAVAILFNPIAPIHLDRGWWELIDVACAVVMLVAAYVVKPKTFEPTPRTIESGHDATSLRRHA